MEWTIEEITKLCKEYCGVCNVSFDSPVIINNRLKSSLGRTSYQRILDVIFPISIEFSADFLSTATNESIIEVIKHECAHYITVAKTHELHGHDQVFRYYCSKLGTTNDGPIDNNIKYKDNITNDQLFKYTLYCSNCGKFLGGRHKKSSFIKNIDTYYSKCCQAPIELRINK